MKTSTAHEHPTSTYVGSVRFRVLGPLEVHESGGRLELGGPKQRTVLAVLLANAGNQVNMGTLIDGVYGEEAPDRAHRSIHTFVSNLRSIIGELIERRGEGYVFTGGRDDLDSTHFEDLLAHAQDAEDPNEKRVLLQDALRLWKGHPYADVESYTGLVSEGTRLNELRIVAIESRVDADLVLGRDRELIAELDSLTAEYPLNDRIRSQQMLALYRAGRAVEALRAYEKHRLDLVEMGLDPSADLRRLEQRILDQDTALELDARPTVKRASVMVAGFADGGELENLRPDERHRLTSTVAAAVDHSVVANAGSVFSQRGSVLYSRFDDATSAAAAAADIMAATSGLIPRIRIAIATGDVEEATGRELTGPPISRAASLVAVGHGGQVLLSSNTQSSISTSGSPGFGMRSLGPHAIPGMKDGEIVHQLDVGDEVVEFPALRVGELPPPLPLSERGVVGYELRDVIGTGTHGRVHRAYQPSLGREVAVKVIEPDFANDPSFIRDFEIEAQLVARLEHPNIVPVHDYWRDPDGAFFVMRLLRGGDLEDRLSAAALNTDELDRVLHSIGSALEYAHRHGVAHGAVTPSNVLFDEEGNVYLGDFAIGRMHTGVDSVARDIAQFARLIARSSGNADQTDELLSQVTSSEGLTSVAAFVESWSESIGRRDTIDVRFTPARNPYKGLRAFGNSTPLTSTDVKPRRHS